MDDLIFLSFICTPEQEWYEFIRFKYVGAHITVLFCYLLFSSLLLLVLEYLWKKFRRRKYTKKRIFKILLFLLLCGVLCCYGEDILLWLLSDFFPCLYYHVYYNPFRGQWQSPFYGKKRRVRKIRKMLPEPYKEKVISPISLTKQEHVIPLVFLVSLLIYKIRIGEKARMTEKLQKALLHNTIFS